MITVKVMHFQGQYRKVECSEISKVIHMYTYLYVYHGRFRKRKIFTCLPCVRKDFSLMCITLFIENQIIWATFIQFGLLRKLHFLSPNPSQCVRSCRSCIVASLPGGVRNVNNISQGLPRVTPHTRMAVLTTSYV